MKNFSKVQLPWVEKEYETSEKAEKQVQIEEVLSDLMQDGSGSSAVTPPPPPTHTPVLDDGGILGVGFLMMILVIMISRMLLKKVFGKSDSVKIDVLSDESPTVRKAIEELYVLHPKACRNCHGSATEPEFWKSGQGEEECHACYARGRDPYDTTKKMKKDGDYRISPTYGIDPLYRGYALPGQKILAMREEEADQWDA